MDRLEQDLRAEWASGPRRSGALPGTPITLLRIPRFGAAWEKPVVEGVGADELARGLGRYPQTQLPGKPSNFAIAGKPGQTPTNTILTLTACQDLFHSPDRSVAFAHLVKLDRSG
ncbi:hypothetical protein Kfla_6735 [Kribbella flavida DSM 17836]|uniref:Uncharacterized protein n=1 Tax=Kribbella flavida (strain DSM 17836 / JCM 10339 / NBRC 14399) TaxID=479435 RepID=D2Q126_KRIFD|nr:sortase [Kribbella flavida]ADB35727.1 hypothetical protein Kfla_6735 [Kribbella flavida DSM 17836]